MCDGWAASVALNVLFGAFGAFFVFKEFGDPEFSEWLSPGAGQASPWPLGNIMFRGSIRKYSGDRTPRGPINVQRVR